MAVSQHKAEVGNRLRIAIEATHGPNLMDWCRDYEVSRFKLGNWLRGDNYPDPVILSRYCADNGLTMDWFYRESLVGVASGVAAALKQRTPASSEGLRALAPPAPKKRA